MERRLEDVRDQPSGPDRPGHPCEPAEFLDYDQRWPVSVRGHGDCVPDFLFKVNLFSISIIHLTYNYINSIICYMTALLNKLFT